MKTFPSRNLYLSLAALGAALLAAPGSRACSVCGCSLSSDWASQGYAMSPGLEADVTYQYYDQDNLRSGTGSVDRSAYAFPNARELQQDTLTRSTTLGIDYVPGPRWGLDLIVPYYDRFHSTVAPGDTVLSESRASGVGDAKLVARFQTYSLRQSFGLQLGIKLPTGKYTQDFATGPQAGAPLDRGLQLGTGTTDLIAGVSYFGRLFPYVGYFGQASYQQALGQRDAFMPSPSLNVNLGVRYLNATTLTPLFQLNARLDGRERGLNADTDNSGGIAVYASPGLTVEAGPNRSLFAFLQVPVYQRVNGLQLEPRWLISAGFRWRM
jgi:hypothetical protein